MTERFHHLVTTRQRYHLLALTIMNEIVTTRRLPPRSHLPSGGGNGGGNARKTAENTPLLLPFFSYSKKRKIKKKGAYIEKRFWSERGGNTAEIARYSIVGAGA